MKYEFCLLAIRIHNIDANLEKILENYGNVLLVHE